MSKISYHVGGNQYHCIWQEMDDSIFRYVSIEAFEEIQELTYDPINESITWPAGSSTHLYVNKKTDRRP